MLMAICFFTPRQCISFLPLSFRAEYGILLMFQCQEGLFLYFRLSLSDRNRETVCLWMRQGQ